MVIGVLTMATADKNNVDRDDVFGAVMPKLSILSDIRQDLESIY